MGKFASMLCDMEWYMNKYSATTEEHVHNITIIVDVSVLGNTVGHGEKKRMECLHPQVFDLKLKERGEVNCTLFLSPPTFFPPLLHVRGGITFDCKAQCLCGAKRECTHLGANARVRPGNCTLGATQQME